MDGIMLVGMIAAVLIGIVILSFAKGEEGWAFRFRLPVFAYEVVAIIIIAVAFLVSIGISKAYWEYFIARPPVLSEIDQIAEVRAVIPVEIKWNDDGDRTVVVWEDFSLAERVADGKEDSYYCLDERLLLALEQRELLPSTHSTTLIEFPALYPLIKGSGLLAVPDEGYEDSDIIQGVVVDAVDESGARAVFLGIRGRQVWNDHYPYYEMLFLGRTGSSELTYVRGQLFFYDVAGIEGLEWYVIWPYLSVVGVAAGFFVLTIGIASYRGTKRIAKGREMACWNEPWTLHRLHWVRLIVS